jgi:hypothetical protein
MHPGSRARPRSARASGPSPRAAWRGDGRGASARSRACRRCTRGGARRPIAPGRRDGRWSGPGPRGCPSRSARRSRGRGDGSEDEVPPFEGDERADDERWVERRGIRVDHDHACRPIFELAQEELGQATSAIALGLGLERERGRDARVEPGAGIAGGEDQDLPPHGGEHARRIPEVEEVEQHRLMEPRGGFRTKRGRQSRHHPTGLRPLAEDAQHAPLWQAPGHLNAPGLRPRAGARTGRG